MVPRTNSPISMNDRHGIFICCFARYGLSDRVLLVDQIYLLLVCLFVSLTMLDIVG